MELANNILEESIPPVEREIYSFECCLLKIVFTVFLGELQTNRDSGGCSDDVEGVV